jgi:2-succinyl-6-hydroxy-2,4-cyclohexadiene-1-carboxylate synthase
VAADLPGHGGSSAVRTALFETAELVAETCGPADYVGYSLGGRVLLHLAISRPDVVRRAVLIGATAGIEDESERAARVKADELLALQLDEVRDDKVALGEFLRRWLAGPLFADLGEESACIAERMDNDAAGLASSLRLSGTGRQVPLWNRLSELSMPILVIAGENDARFCSLAERIAGSAGDRARVAVVPGAGHACHLARPVETAEIIERFWSDT